MRCLPVNPSVNMKILKLFLNAIVAWILGLACIAAILYFSNGGVDFTVTDLTGFGVLAIAVSGLLMLVLYLPSLYWLKRRHGGVERRIQFVLLAGLLCNIPIIIFLLTLINRKMVLSEALGFIATFLIIGSAFGLGFTLATDQHR
jgi:archaellum biogenesis protein FlaJ (TadC family)